MKTTQSEVNTSTFTGQVQATETFRTVNYYVIGEDDILNNEYFEKLMDNLSTK